MVSNDERRRIAKELREAAYVRRGRIFPYAKLALIVSKGRAWAWRSVFVRLAKLIDRPTCEALYYMKPENQGEQPVPCDDGYFDYCQCGNCGAVMFTHPDFSLGRYVPSDYCHNCGAEVER